MTIGGSMINFPRQSIAAALRAEMHGYEWMAEISEDDIKPVAAAVSYWLDTVV